VTDYLQARGAASAVRPSPIELRPPLHLVWDLVDVGATPLVTNGYCVVWAGGDRALICVDQNGRERWRHGCEFVRHGILGDAVVAIVGIALPDVTRFVALDLHTGRELRSAACDHLIDKILPGGQIFVGSTTKQLSEEQFKFVVAMVELSREVEVLWTRSTEHDYRNGPCDVAYDSDVACDEERVFVVRGSELVALDLKTGEDDWAAPLRALGGAPTFQGKSLPMVAQGLVVINTAGGTAAFSVADGQCSWFFPKAGARSVYGGRVYFVTTDEYYILDLMTGACLLQVPFAAMVEQKWRLKRVQCASHLAVSDTNGFVGDTRGRLYSFERDTGEPVWKDQPEGITGFSGNIPVIAGNRLYISSFSMAPAPPPRLYCYEGAG